MGDFHLEQGRALPHHAPSPATDTRPQQGTRLTATKAPSRSDLAAALEVFAASSTRSQYELLLAESERAISRLLLEGDIP